MNSNYFPTKNEKPHLPCARGKRKDKRRKELKGELKSEEWETIEWSQEQIRNWWIFNSKQAWRRRRTFDSLQYFFNTIACSLLLRLQPASKFPTQSRLLFEIIVDNGTTKRQFARTPTRDGFLHRPDHRRLFVLCLLKFMWPNNKSKWVFIRFKLEWNAEWEGWRKKHKKNRAVEM